MAEKLLKSFLFLLSGYFFLISGAHMVGVKLPLLFVYFDVPSYAYQDRIISFFAFGWGVFLATAARDPMGNRPLVQAVIIAGLVAIIWLAINNLVTDFSGLQAGLRLWAYWAQTGILALIVLCLFLLYKRSIS